MNSEKLSLTYHFLRILGMHYSEKDYGQVTLWQLIKRVHKTVRDSFLLMWERTYLLEIQ